MDQQCLARLERCPADKPDVCCLVSNRECGRLCVVEGLGRREDCRRGNQRPLSQAAVRGCRHADYAVTDSDPDRDT